MTYTQAKLAVHDLSLISNLKLSAAAAVLLSNMDATPEDIADASDLLNRAAMARTTFA